MRILDTRVLACKGAGAFTGGCPLLAACVAVSEGDAAGDLLTEVPAGLGVATMGGVDMVVGAKVNADAAHEQVKGTRARARVIMGAVQWMVCPIDEPLIDLI